MTLCKSSLLRILRPRHTVHPEHKKSPELQGFLKRVTPILPKHVRVYDFL